MRIKDLLNTITWVHESQPDLSWISCAREALNVLEANREPETKPERRDD